MAVCVVVLSDYQDIFDQFQTSIDKFEPFSSKRVLVKSENTTIILDKPERWGKVIYAPNHFIFARNANLGINLYPEADILLTNDDVQFTHPQSISTLAKEAYSDPSIGIISPVVRGQIGNSLQYFDPDETEKKLIYSKERLAFVCVYIKREVINKIGGLDEEFDGYGGDDVDYCIRTQKAGYKLAVTNKVMVEHGFKECKASSSFNRVMGGLQTHLSMLSMNKLVSQKHKIIRFKYDHE
jgi:GT2 family glycosyltransferase